MISVCLSVYLSICLSVCISIYLSTLIWQNVFSYYYYSANLCMLYFQCVIHISTEMVFLNCWHLVPAVTAKIDISECLSLLFGKLKLCIFLSFIMLWLLLPSANYDLAINEDYLAGNAKIKISIRKTKWRRCHIRRALATVANRKCGPENTVRFWKWRALISLTF